MNFEDLPLHPSVLKALKKAGYETPTQIQLKAIPKIAKGHDIRASAQTGTGKTAAFLLPILSRLTVQSKASGRGPRALVLVPTRELAMQVSEQAQKYSRELHWLKTACVVGGVPYPVQLRKLAKPCDVLIATPGRLIDFLQQGKVNFSRLEVVVLDEADRMLDMGFAEPVQHILEAMPETRQTLLFSATLEGSVMRLSEKFMKKPMEIVVQSDTKSHENIDQKLYRTDNLGHKTRLLEHILAQEEVGHTIVFTATKRHANQLEGELQDMGFRAASLHGDMTQRQRTRTLQQLREGRVDILVATDVAARGIDVKSITHVINFDLPQNVEDYVHRIGRTGRAGALGTAISFASGGEGFFVKKIEKFTNKDMTVSEIEGLEARTKQKSFDEAPGGRKKFKRAHRGSGGVGADKSNSRPFGRSGERPRHRDREQSRPTRFGSRADRPDGAANGGNKPGSSWGSKSSSGKSQGHGPWARTGAKPDARTGAKAAARAGAGAFAGFKKPGDKPGGKFRGKSNFKSNAHRGSGPGNPKRRSRG